MTTAPTRRAQPIILVRGFGGLSVEDEKKIAYQGFNDGTVYPRKRGENYIYEGLILRFLKSSRWQYRDATNVVGYYASEQKAPEDAKTLLPDIDPSFFEGHIVIDPGMAVTLMDPKVDPLRMLWVFRYYDLDRRKFELYGEMLVRLIDFIRELARVHPKAAGAPPKVNIIAHSMGGLIVRHALQATYPRAGRQGAEFVNKVVTLGTPHKGISFQLLKNWLPVEAQDDLESFNPERQEAEENPTGWRHFSKSFPPSRVLTVVGTNYRTFEVAASSWANRLFSVRGEYGLNYNRSDGLVKQDYAQLPDAPRAFVHKCHGGPDSLVTSRESFEVAARFFFGNIRARLRLVSAEVRSGHDLIGRSEFYFGVSVKPRGVDFDLFHQSAEAENCYGPFAQPDLGDESPTFGWARDRKGLIWEGWLDTGARAPTADRQQEKVAEKQETAAPKALRDIAMRLEFYVSERDLLGLRFSDNIIFHRQYVLRAVFDDLGDLETLRTLQISSSENFVGAKDLARQGNEWEFDVEDPNFRATLRVALDPVPEEGDPPD